MYGIYQICEYGTIRSSRDYPSESGTFHHLVIPENAFEDLYNYILENQEINSDSESAFQIYSKKGRRQIKVKSYVGIIETKSGVVLEILPKILTDSSADEAEMTKQVFVKMLRHLKSVKSISIGQAHIASKHKFPLLERYIANFMDLLSEKLSNGLKAEYVEEIDNLSTLRGRVLVTQHTRKNLFDKTKFYCQYSEFSIDNPMNRVIKSTLQLLYQICRSSTNRSRIQTCMMLFGEVSVSENAMQDLIKASSNKANNRGNDEILNWCKMILNKEGFLGFAGKHINIAVLYPMERIFEDYIGYLVKKYAHGYLVTAQDKKYYLVEKHLDAGRFRLRPDLVLTKQEHPEVIIIDTKWKLIDQHSGRKNYNISQADMYQLYAYGKKYGHSATPKLKLVYPKNENFFMPLSRFIYEGDLELEAIPFNFFEDEEVMINKILKY